MSIGSYFEMDSLKVLHTLNGFTMWHYSLEYERAPVLAFHFFEAAKDILEVGDIIIVSNTKNGACAQLSVLPGGRTAIMCLSSGSNGGFYLGF